MRQVGTPLDPVNKNTAGQETSPYPNVLFHFFIGLHGFYPWLNMYHPLQGFGAPKGQPRSGLWVVYSYTPGTLREPRGYSWGSLSG